jgi:uncharacterized membrane protein
LPPDLRPRGERLADGVAATAGSWRRIALRPALLLGCIAANAAAGGGFQAADTAPIIMMSQNRQPDVDRHLAVADYQVKLRRRRRSRFCTRRSTCCGRRSWPR